MIKREKVIKEIFTETVENYNLKSSESTHVGGNDLEYVSQDAGITCNKHIVQKHSSFIEVFKDYKRKRTITPPADTMNTAQKQIKGNTSNNITLQNRPSNVSNRLDYSNNNQNVTSTDGMANLRELAHEIEEINKICNISEMLIAVKKLKSTLQQCTSKSQQFQAFIEFSNGLDS
ncbi:hypothetical protein M0802_012631 [Mischocyttarus mexicanus]|nr:hypothetical protein M0802_012631 [Mischocyttarus mexicanus]